MKKQVSLTVNTQQLGWDLSEMDNKLAQICSNLEVSEAIKESLKKSRKGIINALRALKGEQIQRLKNKLAELESLPLSKEVDSMIMGIKAEIIKIRGEI